MIKSYRNRVTENAANGKYGKKIPGDIRKRLKMRFDRINAAVEADDLRVPPSHHLEALGGDRAGQFSIRVNDRWRVCFRWVDGHAYDVELVDYH